MFHLSRPLTGQSLGVFSSNHNWGYLVPNIISEWISQWFNYACAEGVFGGHLDFKIFLSKISSTFKHWIIGAIIEGVEFFSNIIRWVWNNYVGSWKNKKNRNLLRCFCSQLNIVSWVILVEFLWSNAAFITHTDILYIFLKTIGQRKAFHRQRTPESSCARK